MAVVDLNFTGEEGRKRREAIENLEREIVKRRLAELETQSEDDPQPDEPEIEHPRRIQVPNTGVMVGVVGVDEDGNFIFYDQTTTDSEDSDLWSDF